MSSFKLQNACLFANLHQEIPMVAAAGPRQVRFITTCSNPTEKCKRIMKAQETQRKRGSRELEPTSTNRLLLLKDQPIGVKFALQKMGRDKAVRSGHILIVEWKCLCDEGVKWLAYLFNNIVLSAKMPDE
nr:hypothetical protein [Tanacetum cinerariifolium]